jgi:hypothetical protein
MKLKLYLLALVGISVAQNLFAQPAENQLYYHAGARYGIANPLKVDRVPNSSGQSGTGANIDVVYQRIWWRINPDSAKAIKGTVTTYFKTLAANVSAITLDLRQSSFNNANLVVKHHGITCTRSINASNVLSITLSSTIVASGTLDSVVINYYGVPPGVVGAAQGYQPDTDATTGQTMMYTLSESYEDRDWWPCKADMQDKIDSLDIMVNVPWGSPTAADTFWVACNGKLIDSTISGNSRTFTFKNRYAMASYLVCVSVARYNRYYRSVNVNGTNTQVAYYLHRGKSNANYTAILNAMDLQNQVLAAFSLKYGDYPYKYEKHGYYDGLKGAGGMEHQTFSAIDGGTLAGTTGSLTSASVLAHELTHQWFGDKATFATWADIYLAEGFARYGEALAGELVPATGLNPVTERGAAKTAARGVTTVPTRILSYGTSAQVWSTAGNVSAMYDRGCMVVSMLRSLSGDNNFFQACRNYLDSTTGSGYKSATTDSLKNNFSSVLGGYNLTPFFNDWVIGVGHPSTVVNWNTNAPNRLVVSVGSQTRSAGATATYFHNVIVLRVQGALAANDTTIVIYDIDGNNLAKAGNGISAATPGNLLTYDLSFTPTTVTFDPFNMTMSAGSTFKLSALATTILNFTAQKSNTGNIVQLSITNSQPVVKTILLKSTDGINFTEVGEMQQINNNTADINYQFGDAAPYAVITYYKAKIITSGKEQFTAIVKVQEPKTIAFVVSPNPAEEEVHISFTNTNREKVNIKVLSIEGKVVIESTTHNNFIHYNINRLPAGMYWIHLSKQGQKTITGKFMIQH